MQATSRAPSPGTAPTGPASNGNDRGHKRLSEIQRARMLAAVVEVACERTAGNVTVAQVVARAGVSRRTFYEIFKDGEDCLLAAFDDAVHRASACAVAAYESQGRWREKMRASLTALLELFDEEPHLGRFVVVETLAAGPRALRARQQALDFVMVAVQEGDPRGRSGASMPIAAEAVVGAVFSVIHARMLQPDQGSLIQLVNPLMSTIVLPYLGPAAARRELQQPAIRTAKLPPRAVENPLKQLHARLTYRTVRALLAVADQPRSSNRAIADAAGIADQGQVSKLLARLEGLGLVKNVGGGSHRGEANAWTLTRAGEEVHDAIATRASAV